MAVCGKCHREAPDAALFCAFCGEPLGASAPGGEVDPLIGQTVSGKYLIHELLGRGGMGDVYKATHLTLDRPVVLKLLKKLFHSDPSLVQRFHREARAASRLNHPNSITIIDFGQTDDGTLFMAMEFLAGRSLERVVAEEHPIAEGRVVHVGAQILSALAEAHALGIIHRDLKPANVMIEPRRDDPEFVKVLDFGIAKLSEPGEGITQAGIVCGTPGYMSPEQVRGEDLDARSDLYAVGVILYEMLTGLLPFESETPMGLVTKHLVEDPQPIAARRPGTRVSPDLEEIVMRALARERDHRFASADEMREALLACAAAPRAAALRMTPVPSSSTMVFDPAAPAAAARPTTGSGRTPPGSGAVPPPAHRTPSAARAMPSPPPARTQALPAEASRASAPSPVAPPPSAAARATASEPPRRVRPALAVAGVAGVAAVAVAVWATLARSPAPPAAEVVPPGERQAAIPASPPTSAEPARSAPPPAAPAPAASAPAAPAPEVQAAAPASAPRVVRRVKATAPAATKGIRLVRGELNSIATPPASSGDGVLTVVATPWAEVAVDGRELGETPRVLRLGAGTYRVRATNPELGTREEVVTIRAGKSHMWSATFAR